MLNLDMGKRIRRPGALPARNWTNLRLREHLQARGWTAAELVRRTKMSKGMISLVLSGQSAGSPETLEKIAEALGLSDVGELFKEPIEIGKRKLEVAVPESDYDRLRDIIRAFTRHHVWIPIIAILSLAGCASAEEVAKADDEKCRSYGAAVASEAYVQCRATLDAARTVARNVGGSITRMPSTPAPLPSSWPRF